MHKKSSHKLSQLISVMSDGEYHDGTALGEVLKMTRSAVWKMIKKLERYGLEISSVKGKGYALCEPVVLLDIEKIRENLTGEIPHLQLFESVESTNDHLKSIRHAKDPHFCLAEQQTNGRGRLNRAWHSPFGKNIILSCLYPFNKDISELSGLSLVVSLAIMRTLNRFGMTDDVFVKWPNDILAANKKISGTLIELQAESHGVCQAVIGIGLNVNMLIDEREQISQPWTSMRCETREYLDRNAVSATLIAYLLDYLRRFDRDGFEHFMQEWLDAEGMRDNEVTLKSGQVTVKGMVVGINSQGHLLLKLENGEVKAFSSGDTSITKKA